VDCQSAICRSWADPICNLIQRNPPPPGGFPVYYVPWSRTGRKRTPPEEPPPRLIGVSCLLCSLIKNREEPDQEREEEDHPQDLSFWFLVCYATTQLATQLHQRCTQVVCFWFLVCYAATQLATQIQRCMQREQNNLLLLFGPRNIRRSCADPVRTNSSWHYDKCHLSYAGTFRASVVLSFPFLSISAYPGSKPVWSSSYCRSLKTQIMCGYLCVCLLPTCLPVCLSVYLCVSVYLSVCLSVHGVCICVYLSICPSVYLSAHARVCVCLKFRKSARTRSRTWHIWATISVASAPSFLAKLMYVHLSLCLAYVYRIIVQ